MRRANGTERVASADAGGVSILWLLRVSSEERVGDVYIFTIMCSVISYSVLCSHRSAMQRLK